jgi:hypothetical protein
MPGALRLDRRHGDFLPIAAALHQRYRLPFECSAARPAAPGDLKCRGFEFDTLATIREWTEHHMVVLSYHGIRVDWLKSVLPAYVHILDRATEETWLKLLAFRTQDQVDIENLVAANRDSLDLDWIRTEWQTMASLDDPRMRRLMELVDAKP